MGKRLFPKNYLLIKIIFFLACEQIDCFQTCVGKTQAYLDNKLKELEGDSPDYRLKKGFGSSFKKITLAPLKLSVL